MEKFLKWVSQFFDNKFIQVVSMNQNLLILSESDEEEEEDEEEEDDSVNHPYVTILAY